MLSDQIVAVVLNLGVIILLIVLFFWFKKLKTKHVDLNSPIKLTKTLFVGQKERIALIEINDTQILVGITPQQIQTLCTFKSSKKGSEEGEISEFAALVKADCDRM